MIGHSMGAKVAMTVALRSPASIGALIPVDNAPVDAVLKGDFGKYVQGMRQVADSNVARQAEADQILEEFEQKNSSTRKLEFRIPIHILGMALDEMGGFPFKDPDSVRYDGPTLVIRGSRSHYVPDDILPLLGRFFPRFEVRDMNSGHWVISEQPIAFKEAVVGFLSAKID
ncbi:MAG: hypothetical protein MMC23_009661 [Stictis urceolatum]|nr:hypothetical protein [Stictis urceolata]